METKNHEPSTEEVLRRLDMTENEVQLSFEHVLSLSPEELTVFNKGHEKDVAAVEKAMLSPSEIISEAEKRGK